MTSDNFESFLSEICTKEYSINLLMKPIDSISTVKFDEKSSINAHFQANNPNYNPLIDKFNWIDTTTSCKHQQLTKMNDISFTLDFVYINWDVLFCIFLCFSVTNDDEKSCCNLEAVGSWMRIKVKSACCKKVLYKRLPICSWLPK